ncbi:MAG: Maf family protein [Promethearchaeota archaeon]
MKDIILASKSMDRGKLLRNIKIPFTILVTDIDETPFKEKYLNNPIQLVEELAKAKASFAIERLKKEKKEAIVIAADTVVEFAGKIIGKAKTEHEAFQILKKLSGNEHNLITGIAIRDTDDINKIFSHDITKVRFLDLLDKEIWDYIETGEWKGRAGAYSIIDKASIFIESINGSPSNVIGLPLHKIFEILKNKFDIDLLQLK